MKRLRRWLFNLAAGVSLLLGLVTAALWLASYVRHQYFRYGGGGSESDLFKTTQLVWYNGRIEFYTARTDFNLDRDPTIILDKPPPDFRFQYISEPPSPYPDATEYVRSLWAVNVQFNRQSPDHRNFRFNLPGWLFPAAIALAPSLYIRRRRNEHRREFGLCRRCGYDLRASPERCPECGAEVVAAKGLAS